MYLEHLSLLNFKNITTAELDFSASLNCFVGSNGAGKTNILDAVHYLSLTRSSLGMSDAQCVEHGENFFMIKGHYRLPDQRSEQISVSYKRSSGKKVMRSGKEYDRLMNHIGLIPVVMVSPSDTALISESGEERRRFFNTHLSQIDNIYMESLARYNSLLAQRNKLLKSPSGYDEILDILSEQLSDVGAVIYDKRADFTARLSPLVSKYYSQISSDSETVRIEYRSSLAEKPLRELLTENLSKDYALGFTSVGIHRDELLLSIKDYPIRRYGSQGQQKSLLVALRLAEAKIVQQHSGKNAILLLDDVFDKLDIERVGNLIGLVSGEDFGQIFITDSNKVRLEGILGQFASEYRLFCVDGGEVER